MSADLLLAKLRDRKWNVAIHNDYALGGNRHTFWLLTHPSGRWVKGEAPTDVEALDDCLRQIERGHLEGPPHHPYAVQHRGDGWLRIGFSDDKRVQEYWQWLEQQT